MRFQFSNFLDNWSPEITGWKLVSWPAFENLLLTKYQYIDKWIEETTLDFPFIEEEKELSEVITREITDKSLASSITVSINSKNKCKQLEIIIIKLNLMQAQNLAIW